MTNTSDDLSADEQSVKSYSTWYMVFGVLSIIFGGITLTHPFAASMSVEIVAAMSFLLIGVLQLVIAFRARGDRRVLWNVIGGILFILTGIVLLKNPLAGLASLTIVVATSFLILGLFRSFLAFKLRPLSGWGWILFSGIVTTILALVIFGNFPVAAVTVLGLLLGFELISSGISLFMVGMMLRK